MCEHIKCCYHYNVFLYTLVILVCAFYMTVLVETTQKLLIKVSENKQKKCEYGTRVTETRVHTYIHQKQSTTFLEFLSQFRRLIAEIGRLQKQHHPQALPKCGGGVRGEVKGKAGLLGIHEESRSSPTCKANISLLYFFLFLSIYWDEAPFVALIRDVIMFMMDLFPPYSLVVVLVLVLQEKHVLQFRRQSWGHTLQLFSFSRLTAKHSKHLLVLLCKLRLEVTFLPIDLRFFCRMSDCYSHMYYSFYNTKNTWRRRTELQSGKYTTQ